jgi:AsmA protein
MKKVLIGIGIVLLVLVLAVISLPFFVNANEFRPRLESELTTALGREVKVGNLKLDIFGGTVSADELSVADDRKFSTAPFLQARSLKLTVELWPLIASRKLHVLGLLIDQPAIALIQSAEGDWNFSGIGGRKAPAPAPVSSESSPLDLSVQLIKVSGARLALSRLGGPVKPQALEGMDAEIRDFSPTSSFPFSMSAKLASGGDIHLDGKAGPMNSTDAAATPVQVTLKVTNLQMAAAGLVDKASGIDGQLSIDGIGVSNGTELQWNGSVNVDKLKLSKTGKPAARTVQFDFAVAHNVRTHSGVLSRGDVHLGSALAHLTGNYAEQGESMTMRMHLAGTSMPVPELLTFLPPLDIRLPAGSSLQGGTAALEAVANGPVAALVADGTMDVNNTKLTGFDLGSKLSTMEKLAGIKTSPDTVIQTLHAKIHSAPEGQTVQDLKLVLPAIGEVDGAGTVSVNHALDFKMRATVHTSGTLLAALGPKGDTTVPFAIQGTSENPTFKPDMKAIATEEVKRIESVTGAKSAVGGILGGFLGGGKKQ